VVVATCLNDRKVKYFDYQSSPDLLIVDAVRMSSSIPIIYKPFNYQDKLYIDGAVLDDMAIHLVPPSEEVLGILIQPEIETKITKLEDYIGSIINMVTSEMRNRRLYPSYEPYLIQYNIPNKHTLNFDMTENEKKNLVQIGYISILKELLQRPYLIKIIQDEKNKQDDVNSENDDNNNDNNNDNDNNEDDNNNEDEDVNSENDDNNNEDEDVNSEDDNNEEEDEVSENEDNTINISQKDEGDDTIISEKDDDDEISTIKK
jgi:Predicted esterase of the alpha-beta hydrolase superfamily